MSTHSSASASASASPGGTGPATGASQALCPPKLFKGGKTDFEVVIGLEIHAQIVSQSKLFSCASTAFGQEPNQNVSFVDAGFPGMLPVLNAFCVEQGIRTGLGLEGKINHVSVFERKNYFYPDLPAGYQISQFEKPLVSGGFVHIMGHDGNERPIRLNRIHLEQDAGKLLHDLGPSKSYVDLNRSGVALMEIVSEPDMRAPEEAVSFVRKLRAILRALGTCDGNMEQGNLRVDANVSVRLPGEALGTRVEIKNMNSAKFLHQAILYEIDRQIALVESGKKVVQETRLFDTEKGQTRSMRSKEDAHDYRYFPDPDLPPLVVDEVWIEQIRQELPELPDAKRERFQRDFSLSAYDAAVMLEDGETDTFFEEAVVALPADAGAKHFKMLANWILGEVFAALKRFDLSISQCPIRPKALADLVCLCQKGLLSSTLAKEVFAMMWETGKDPHAIVSEKNLAQVSDSDAIEKSVRKVLADEAQQVAQWLSGKEKVFGYLVGQTMKAMQGKGNPQLIQETLKKCLEELKKSS